MAPKITFIKDIKAGSVDWRIKVRVVHLWKIPEYNNHNVTKSMEMVLIDEKSGKIQGSVKKNLLDMFENILQEGTCYLIQNLMVAQNDPKFRATDHRYKLTFMRTTLCMKIDSSAIPENVFKFVTFPEISTGLNDTYLIDIIGHVVERGDLRENEKNGVKTLLMDTVLEDLQGNRMDCTLWGNYVTAMHQYLTANGSTTLVVVILQGSKMRLFNGKIGISNAFDATKLLINPALKECVDYKEKLENGSLSLSQIVSYASGQSSISVADDFLQTPKMTISDMFDVDKECVCVVAAKIIEFDTSMGWYYDACNKCAKKVTQCVGQLYYCGKCAIMVTSNRRCKLQAQVIDESGSAYFTLFDRVAMQCLENPGANLFESNDQKRGRLPSLFSIDFYDEISNYVILEDPVGNQFAVNVVKEKGMVYLDLGWHRIGEVYNLPGGGWLEMFFRNSGHFDIKVKDRMYKEVLYPQPAKWYGDFHLLYKKLSEEEMNSDSLKLALGFCHFSLSRSCLKCHLVDPKLKRYSCNLSWATQKENYCTLSGGWTDFRKAMKLKVGDRLCFGVTVDDPTVIYYVADPSNY